MPQVDQEDLENENFDFDFDYLEREIDNHDDSTKSSD